MTIKTLHSDFTGKYMLTKDMAWLWLHKEKIQNVRDCQIAIFGGK